MRKTVQQMLWCCCNSWHAAGRNAGSPIMVCHISWTLCSGHSYSRQINECKPSSFRIMEQDWSSSSPAAEVLRASWALPIYPILYYLPSKWPVGVSSPVMKLGRLHQVPLRLVPPLMRTQKSSASCAWVNSHLQPLQSYRAATVSSALRWVKTSITCSSRTCQLQSGSNGRKQDLIGTVRKQICYEVISTTWPLPPLIHIAHTLRHSSFAIVTR